MSTTDNFLTYLNLENHFNEKGTLTVPNEHQ